MQSSTIIDWSCTFVNSSLFLFLVNRVIKGSNGGQPPIINIHSYKLWTVRGLGHWTF